MDSDIIGLRVSRDGLFVLMGDGRALPLPNFFSVGFARHPTEPPAEATPGSGPAPTLQSGTVFSTTPTSRLSVESKASLLAALVDELKTLLQEVEALRAFKASVPWAALETATFLGAAFQEPYSPEALERKHKAQAAYEWVVATRNREGV